MIDPDDYDCLNCGACCVADIETEDYVHLRPDDVAQLTASERASAVHTTVLPSGESQFSMKTTRDRHGNCRCTLLQGSVGERVSCSIYDRRPAACRRFPAGSNVCDYARQSVLGISLK